MRKDTIAALTRQRRGAADRLLRSGRHHECDGRSPSPPTCEPQGGTNDEARIDQIKAKLANGETPTDREFRKILRERGFSNSDAEEIASLAAFLASADAALITGTCPTADGGWLA